MTTSNTIRYRTLANNEITLIEPLWQQLRHYQAQRTRFHHAHYESADFRSRCEQLARTDAFALFVGEASGQLLAYVITSYREGVGSIDSIFVSPTARAQGCGKQLMTLALNWLKEHHIEPVRLLVGEGNEDVIAFYEHLGFVPRATQLEWRAKKA